MHFLYYIGLKLYTLGVFIASFFNEKARFFRVGRKNLFTRLQAAIPEGAQVAWFHCPSFGEFEQGRTLMEAYRRQFPEHKILLTFFSPSGYEYCKNYTGADFIFYLPIDTPRNARRFINTVQPKIVFFIKYDFWYNILKRLKKQAIPTYLIAAIFRPSQVFFKWYGGFFRTMLRAYTHIFVQNRESEELLQSLGITNISIIGDTRFDRVVELAQQSKNFPILQKFSIIQPTIIAGSTWSADEEILAQVFPNLPPCKMVVAPHNIHEEHIAAVVKRFAPFGVVRYSELSDDSDFGGINVLVLDTMGMLASAYKYGQIAYIGGGFGAAGIHNAIEAAVYGVPIVFGPIYDMFHEACELVELGGTLVFNKKEELEAILSRWITTAEGSSLGEINKKYVLKNGGATGKIIEKITADMCR